MVKGIDIFQKHFKDYSDYYAIIGGAAASGLLAADGILKQIEENKFN